MRRYLFLVVCALAVVLSVSLFAGCGETGGPGGSGGVGGTGGVGGSGGVGGTGGVAGTGGTGGIGGISGCESAADCDDGNECTVDRCDPLDYSWCSHTILPDATLCDLGGEDGVCVSGACVPNTCPMLFFIRASPTTIPPGQTSTMIETRAQDADGLPLPLVLSLSAPWGSFENSDNIQEPDNVVSQQSTYICDRPGPVEICVEATDGACVKRLCTDVMCPD